ncbi:MAG: hypothetical protein RLZZ422_1067 [Pseudomonadota bacterium]|jgi:hypothetical protein
MTTIFISGSRSISCLSNQVLQRINNIVNQKFNIVVGDANGVDKAIQKYLASMSYPNVTIYCSGESCRNNLGNWSEQHITVPNNLKGRDFYTQKDLAMAKVADYGFILWDGKSVGSLNNLIELQEQHKKVLVYFSPKNSLYTIYNQQSLLELIEKFAILLKDQLGTKLNSMSATKGQLVSYIA